MELFKTPVSKNIRTLYFLLLSTATLLILILITGTIFALVRHPDAGALIKLGKTKTKQPAVVEIQESDIRIFSGLGRLRISLVNSSVLILSIAFPYQANDIPFTEELAVKLGDLKNIAIDYFSPFSIDQITFLDEEAAKTEILKLYNANLHLGHIAALYFTDMIIIDAG
jgi:flagellar basal body-associated protein FliL